MGPSLPRIHAETPKKVGQSSLRGVELEVGTGLLSLPGLTASKLSIHVCLPCHVVYCLLTTYQSFRACQGSTRPNGEQKRLSMSCSHRRTRSRSDTYSVSPYNRSCMELVGTRRLGLIRSGTQ